MRRSLPRFLMLAALGSRSGRGRRHSNVMLQRSFFDCGHVRRRTNARFCMRGRPAAQQTMKKLLRAQHLQPATIAQLRALLDTFTGQYNQQRPHRSCGAPEVCVPCELQ